MSKEVSRVLDLVGSGSVARRLVSTDAGGAVVTVAAVEREGGGFSPWVAVL